MKPARLVLLGRPVMHSLSPRMQRAALDAAGITIRYSALDVAPNKLSATFHELCDAKAAGNITTPYKQAAFTLCESLTPVAQAARAVNTFWVADGRSVGDNTDVPGFAVAAETLMRGAGKRVPRRVALIGAGGAASAVAVATSAWEGTEVCVWARSWNRSNAFAQRFAHVRACASIAEATDDAELVVNATPIGLRGSDIPYPVQNLPSGCAVLDLVYREEKTPWVRAALESGRPAADGLRMLVEQGALAFTRWFGIDPDREAMWQSVTSETA